LKKCGKSKNYLYLAKNKEAFDEITNNPLAEDIVNLVIIMEGNSEYI
jgi:hypothetical protein